MPELPEVETVCRGLRELLCDQTIDLVTLHRPNLRYPFPFMMEERLSGVSVQTVRRRAKYILIDLSSSETWLIHLGMSGKFHQLPAGQMVGKHDHLVLSLQNGNTICYNDPRRFGYMALMPTAEIDQSVHIQPLGWEPLDPALTSMHVYERFCQSERPIKTALLEQHRLVGLGNIYVCESLWQAGIDPMRSAQTITIQEWEKLFPAIQAVLRKAIEAGGSTLKDYKQLDGNMGYFQHQFSVYGREGRGCQNDHCNGTIRRVVQSGRSTFYCPSCQK